MLSHLTAGDEPTSISADLGLTALRVASGLMMAFGHGLAKVPPAAGLGFPLPDVFAWAAGPSKLAAGCAVMLAAGCAGMLAAGCAGMLPAGCAVAHDIAERPRPTRIPFIGAVVDADTGEAIAARVYLHDSEGNWLFVRSASEQGTAWPYAEAWVPMPQSIERHTTVSAHPFTADLEPGEYQVVIERGKEYLPLDVRLEVPAVESPPAGRQPTPEPLRRTFPLQRFSDMASRGWFSGETHVHRRIAELPNVMAAEELNVAFPVTFWTTSADAPPGLEPSALRSQGPSPFGPREDRGPDPIWIGDRQVILPRNTEYEIFSVGPRRHTLGAVFILNHRTPFTQIAPPVRPIVDQARRERALLDLDKHNWPWSLMLVPVAKVDLFELSNNSVWRTRFGFTQPGQALPPWKEFEQESPGTLTEWGWLEFGFEMYYALLNCGFRMSPTAGTASGVHPVPLGYGRVYVQTGETFDLEAWLDGLRRGRSFVTTGPMLTARVGDEWPGHVFEVGDDDPREFAWTTEVVSPDPISRVELIVNGRVEAALTPAATRTKQGAWHWSGGGSFRIDRPRGGEAAANPSGRSDAGDGVARSCWAAVRTWSDQPDGRKRFAHTGVWHVDVAGQPVAPSREQIDYLVAQLDAALERQRGVLPAAALAEFVQAQAAYRDIQARVSGAVVSQRRPANSEADERFWLETMAIWHGYTVTEMSQVLGRTPAEVQGLLRTHDLHEIHPGPVRPKDRVAIMPYPGGRHPRRGFLDGAIGPQRETKFSVFPPWSDGGYVVADVPEAVFCNLGLIYLAHTHIPTLWDLEGKSLPAQEWQRLDDGMLKSTRELPNGMCFEVTITPRSNHVRMEMALRNGTDAPLTDLRVQHCLMLARAPEFSPGSNDNKIFHGDYGLVRNPEGNRWLITSWKPLGRAWGNPPVPCLHADPILPDCPPGGTSRAQGWLSFFEGTDWQAEIDRIENLRWWEAVAD
jgi:hypothetical protein